ncbi:voltage-dependent T-type calcium channel subunit alpha-1H [Trichonephila inaurata madagascariensis]|uniref:Voltage-dependent T-type calcium channel subunit alpha-1H n=1 Tax=Trichonephila inaurata madagascariensis TaxID=2747483 RepID=A0A8X7C8H4_9ARAC|nr:voltage-dependent T-type calcium channel subunit alpha-1H [Trichonephila inaurata madagascariensis]
MGQRNPGLHVFNHRHCNGGVPLLRGERILKDTEVHLTHKDVSPQYSLRSQDSLPPDLGSLASVSIYPSRHNSVSSTCTVPDPGLPVTLEEEEPALVPIGPMPPDCKNDKCEITEKICWIIEPKGWIKKRENYSIFLFPPSNSTEIILVAGDCEGSVVRESCLLQEWLERDGRIIGHHLSGRLLSVLHRGRKPAHLRNPARLPPPQITQAAQSHQSGSRTETGGPDSALLSQTHRKHCAHLLHVLHHLWHFGRPAHRELQRVEVALLHIFPASGCVLRAQHVRGGGRGELPPVPGRAGEGGEGPPSREKSQETGEEEAK